jgi:hypothetical protein
MKRKQMMFLTLFILGIGWVSAQVSSISGKVISAEDGLPVIGATIIVKGTSIGTVTDIDGNFTLNLPSDANTLVISYVGKETVEVTAKNGMIVELFDSVSQLDEVIITAFGTTTKKVLLKGNIFGIEIPMTHIEYIMKSKKSTFIENK